MPSNEPRSPFPVCPGHMIPKNMSRTMRMTMGAASPQAVHIRSRTARTFPNSSSAAASPLGRPSPIPAVLPSAKPAETSLLHLVPRLPDRFGDLPESYNSRVDLRRRLLRRQVHHRALHPFEAAEGPLNIEGAARAVHPLDLQYRFFHESPIADQDRARSNRSPRVRAGRSFSCITGGILLF